MHVDFEEGHRLYTYIGDHFAAGVGILVHQRHVPNIIRHQPVSDRLLEVDIRIGERVFAFIAVYMPHAGYHIDILNSTYEIQVRTPSSLRAIWQIFRNSLKIKTEPDNGNQQSPIVFT